MSSKYGPVRQLGYVVRDIHAAMRYWIEELGVGPFFYLKQMPIAEFRYRGQPSPVKLRAAFAYSGDVQIELVQQCGPARSLFEDFLAAHGEGLHHLTFWAEDLDAAVEQALSDGFIITQDGCGEDPSRRFVFLDKACPPGAVLELSALAPGKVALAFKLAAAAADWDGADPIRNLDNSTFFGPDRS